MGGVIKNVAYHLQIYEILKEKILSGELRCKEKINEFALAQEMGVSRSPVREALRMLEQDDLIVPGNNGLIVNPMEYEDVLEIYDCRIVLEPYAAGLGCENVTEDILKQLKEMVSQSLKFHEQGKIREVILCNTRFHDLIISLCSNKHLKRITERTRSLSMLARNQEFSVLNRPKEYLAEHEEIIEALRALDRDRVEESVKKHIIGDKAFYMQCAKANG